MEMLLHPEKKRANDSEESSQAGPPDTKRTRHETSGAMDSKELASAVALASLASFSPSTNVVVRPKQDNFSEILEPPVATTSTLLDATSPRTEPTPISPEAHSPIRPIRRVQFVSAGKDGSNQEGLGQRSVFPPSAPNHHSFPARGPPPALGFPGMARHQPPPPPHWTHSRMPPQRVLHPSFGHGNLHWICDYCNAAAFSTYEEACMHEDVCKVQCRQNEANGSIRHLAPFNVTSGPGNHPFERVMKHVGTGRETSAVESFSGSICLSIPESDPEWLSELNCYVRKFCVEAFSATEDDVLSTSKRGRITLHQVGIRCRYCRHRPLKERAVAAVSYPTSVAGIYESVKRFEKVHLSQCKDIPNEVSSKISELQSQTVWIPTTRQYWTDSARALGMVDTEEGIRFSCDPKYIREANTVENNETSIVSAHHPKSMFDGKVLADGEHIVFPEDTRIVPPYVYFLMRQVESCHFSEVDRFVARSKGPVGYPGFQCRHCSGHAGLGKYFPVSAKTLSTNSTSQNIHAHLLKCRKCPAHIKDKLVALKLEKSRSPRLEPGWRKIFFDKVWHRLHG